MSLLQTKMSKDSDRARVERNLEDMMGDDWRTFRAKLVARETQDPSSLYHDSDSLQEKSQALGGSVGAGIGNLFAGAISSILSPILPDRPAPREEEEQEVEVINLETGENVGAVTSVNDPFASMEEIIAWNSPTPNRLQFNKHKWAHDIPHIEPGCVLLANEKLGGVFHQTVVLIIDHDENTGSTGICINRPLPGNLLKIASEASEASSNLDLNLKLTFNSAPVSFGGPIMNQDYSILHGYGEVEGSKKVVPGVFVGGSRSLMSEVRKNRCKPDQVLFIKGHGAWISKQLSREVSKGVWYVASVSSDFILRYANGNKGEKDEGNFYEHDLWSDILNAMGGKYAEIAKRYAGKGDLRMKP